MFGNVLMRYTWIIVFVLRQFAPIKKYMENQIVLFLIAFIEIFRRFVWNIFRLENEHLNNCGQYRAVRDIPLPYETGKEEEENSDTQSSASLNESPKIPTVWSKFLWKRKSATITTSPKTSKGEEKLNLLEEGKAKYHTYGSLN
jgi:hypothetical protein